MAQTANAHFKDFLKQDGRFVPGNTVRQAAWVLLGEWGSCKGCPKEVRRLFFMALHNGELVEHDELVVVGARRVTTISGFRTLTTAEREDRDQAREKALQKQMRREGSGWRPRVA